MFNLLSFSILIVTANVFSSEGREIERARQRIVGGEQTSINKLPYQIQLLQDGSQICGGSIISESWILTAAHCIVSPPADLSVMTGSDKLGSGGQLHWVKRTIVHPDYDQNTNDNDIALIELKDNIKYAENQEPVELASTVPVAGDTITVSGFGKEYEGEDAQSSPKLKAANIPVVDFEECRQKYIRDPISENVFCAGEGPTDACQGDSGGPAVIDGILVGVVSAGMDCGDTYYPGLYTRVVNYRQWISDTMNNVQQKNPPKYPAHDQSPKYPTKVQPPKHPINNAFLPFGHGSLLGKIADGFLNKLG